MNDELAQRLLEHVPQMLAAIHNVGDDGEMERKELLTVTAISLAVMASTVDVPEHQQEIFLSELLKIVWDTFSYSRKIAKINENIFGKQ